MADINHPKVFISHASEDKDRFVIPFATCLRENGVDAWVDQWEMAPGDSLVDKIFEEGLKNAQAIVIVLSSNSVNKPWVREELNAGVVNKITRKTKIIPVVIDECEVPESLRSTLWERISDLSNYESSFRKILSAIYGISEKPKLGEPPRHVQLQIDKMPGLSSRDTKILQLACEISLETGSEFVQATSLKQALNDSGISEDEAIDSLHILEDRILVKVSWHMGGGLPFFKITTHGFENYAKFFITDFNDLVNNTILTVLNQGLTLNSTIANHLNVAPILIEYILDILVSRKYIKTSKFIGGGVTVHEVTPQGRRYAEDLR